MITLTKIFRFEAAHAIHGYTGACANIHGHSYELHVCVSGTHQDHRFIEGSGMVIDFKDLKKVVAGSVINKLDHKLILSKRYQTVNNMPHSDSLLTFPGEPTAENLLIFIREEINRSLPVGIKLHSLKLYETHDSYAEWSMP
ncbi:MAG: 6-pyruvoyl trahydropterin synthase family protein [Bacteroidota bacterium]